MSKWVSVAMINDCPPSSGIECVAEDRIVALYHVNGEYYALDGICPHQGGPLGKGRVEDGIVTCPWHGWQFDVRNGEHQTNRSLRHATLPVKVQGDNIYVDLDG